MTIVYVNIKKGSYSAKSSYLGGINRRDDVAKNNWSLKDILIPVLSTLVALAGIASGIYTQRSSTQAQIEMKRYEVTFENNQKNYAEFMNYVRLIWKNAVGKDKEQHGQNVEQLMYSYYSMEPFLSENSRHIIFNEIDDFRGFCVDILNDQNINMEDTIETPREIQMVQTYADHERKFRDTLCKELFGMKPSTK